MNPIEWVINKIISFIFRIYPQPRPHKNLLLKTKLVAHRGVHEISNVRENSMAAFALAVENKIWAIEFDVRFTNDNIPVIHHDPHCGRLFNRKDLVIHECSYEKLKNEVELPTLTDVVSRFAKKIHLMIEVKEDLRSQPEKTAQLLQALRALTPVADYHLLTLTPVFLQSIQSVTPMAMLDVIWLAARSTLRANDELNHGAIAGHFLFFNAQRISELKRKNKQIGVGFIDSKNSLFRELNRGIDYIFTNHPLRLNTYVREALQKSLDP